jgi:hypothetical protein
MSKPLYNKSKTYLLPLIAPLIGIEEKHFDNLENTFMFDSNNEFNECFYIYHDFSFRNPEFTKYEHKLTKSYLFKKLIDISKDKVLYIFNFPEEYLHEYYCLQDSKYSEFGEDAKQQILNFWTKLYGKVPAGIKMILKIKQILYKDKKLKLQLEESLSSKNHKVVLEDTAELGEKLEIDNEIFNINEY